MSFLSWLLSHHRYCAEKHLPDHQKSIAPSHLGGIAGGQKYVLANIVFKFAQDVALENGDYIYGGNSPDQARS
jgi:hypothetical protein